MPFPNLPLKTGIITPIEEMIAVTNILASEEQHFFYQNYCFETTRNFRETYKPYNACGTMEKVWDELKKIDAQADQIQSDAQEKAKKITVLAKEEAEKLSCTIAKLTLKKRRRSST